MHALNLHRSMRVSTLVALACAALLGCWSAPRPADVAIYASGTDLESGNPLVTIHSLSRQLQRYALFVTLAKYDAELRPVPYAARGWDWSADRRSLTVRLVPPPGCAGMTASRRRRAMSRSRSMRPAIRRLASGARRISLASTAFVWWTIRPPSSTFERRSLPFPPFYASCRSFPRTCWGASHTAR